MAAIRLMDGLKVVDLGVGMAPALSAKMLADLGAQVSRIEPDGGDPFAGIYPAYAIWRAKATIRPAADLEALLGDADLCILGGEDHPDVERRRDAAEIAARHPNLVVLDMTDGPAGTAYTGPSTELLAQVRSGLVWEQEPDRPIVNAFEPATYGAALQGLIGAIGALIHRERTGKGQVVSTSLLQGALPWIGTYWAKIENPTPAADFVIPRGVAPLIFETRDGKFIHMAIGGTGSKYGFYQALGIDDPTVLPSDSGMPQPGGSRKDFFGNFDLLAEHVAKWDADELLGRIWERGLPAELVQDAGACWSEQQIALNGIIETRPDGTRNVGVPFAIRHLADGAPKKGNSGTQPLAGYRVVDCGAFVAGPLASVYLADLGAEVIKVEAKQGDPNRAIYKSYLVANRCKKAIGVDMKNADGLQAVKDLCATADVVTNNFRPGASRRLGVDPASLSALNPALVVLEAPAFGSEGPLALKAGFDMVMQAWTGHETKAAGTGNAPRWNRTNLVDIAGGMIGAVAAVAALWHRERTGETVSLDSPLCNAGIYTLSGLIQQPDGTFTGEPTLSGSLSGYTPYEGLYRTSDGWVAVVARGDRAKAGLLAALGLAEASEEAIAAKLSALDAVSAIASLSAAGVWAEPCEDGKEQQILSDPALIASGAVRVTNHAKFGKINELAAGFSLSGAPTGNDLCAPDKGQQTRELLESAGYSTERIDALYEAGAVC